MKTQESKHEEHAGEIEDRVSLVGIPFVSFDEMDQITLDDVTLLKLFSKNSVVVATARETELEAVLPQVAPFEDWHPGMTAPAIEAPASTETSAQQIQTRSRSQGLRF